jgi:hypothetical protein
MKITSEGQQVSSEVQEMKNSVAMADCPAESTGLSGATRRTVWCHTPDCLVHLGTVAQWLDPGGTGGEKPSDCPV